MALRRSSPAKTRAWRERSAGKLRQKRPGKPEPVEGPLSASEWEQAAWDAAPRVDGVPVCAVTGKPLNRLRDHAHHAVQKQELRRRGLYLYVWDPRNAVYVLADVHGPHEFTGGPHRIPREALPESVWEFARELGQWAEAHVERHHPERRRTVYAARERP
jgi:hypothetical protein